MSATDPSPQDFPLISLRPVTNAQHAWTALLLEQHPGGDLSALARLFIELNLQESLCGLPCIVPLDAPQAMSTELATAFAASFAADGMMLLLPAASCCAAEAATELERLQRLGFRLIARGMAAPGQTLPSAITALALTAVEPPGMKIPPKSLTGPHLALGVDTPALLTAAKTAGFGRFAGKYPLNPVPTQQQKGASRALLLKLLDLVTSDGDTHKIEELLKQTPTLSYQLLKLVNSVSFSLNSKISNFGHAIALLGRRQLQRWLQLLLYAQKSGDAQNPLMALAALRASLCEALCKLRDGDREAQERAYMTGMFSLLDALFAMPLTEILTPLNLDDEVTGALLRHEGPLGALLNLAIGAESAPDAEFGKRLDELGISPLEYARCLVEACHWTIQVGQGA